MTVKYLIYYNNSIIQFYNSNKMNEKDTIRAKIIIAACFHKILSRSVDPCVLFFSNHEFLSNQVIPPDILEKFKKNIIKNHFDKYDQYKTIFETGVFIFPSEIGWNNIDKHVDRMLKINEENFKILIFDCAKCTTKHEIKFDEKDVFNKKNIHYECSNCKQEYIFKYFEQIDIDTAEILLSFKKNTAVKSSQRLISKKMKLLSKDNRD